MCSLAKKLQVVSLNNMESLATVHVLGYGNVTPLLDKAVQCVVTNLSSICIESVTLLPGNLKDKCLYLMSKRGCITDTNLPKVIHENLKVLDLSESDVSDEGLQHLCKCPQLQKIDLNSAKQSRLNISSQGITQLAKKCPSLQTVYLRRCLNLTDEAVIALSAHCPRLRYLNVGGCTLLTDRCLEALGKNSRFLSCLNMANTKITDGGIMHIANGACNQCLKEVHINGCKELTDESVEAILQFCPQINIFLFHGCPKITEMARQALETVTLERASPMKQVTWTIY
ncbi:protein AMN1 homolog [Ostrea edulis]|uniref:protein AMN1 homolog n=1 Tax=Ostrea edulis TaxID=37623 RepID=UPI0024AEEF3E|nr:protein AMN1 homolog [Ostrea edulis]